MYEKYKKLLELNGVKTAQVSRETGIDASTFSHWKKGEYAPKQDTIQKIANYFGIPISYFYDEKESLEPSYYIDEEVAEIAQELHDDPNMRGLFKAARNLSKEDILKFKEIIEGYERGYSGNDEQD